MDWIEEGKRLLHDTQKGGRSLWVEEGETSSAYQAKGRSLWIVRGGKERYSCIGAGTRWILFEDRIINTLYE